MVKSVHSRFIHTITRPDACFRQIMSFFSRKNWKREVPDLYRNTKKDLAIMVLTASGICGVLLGTFYQSLAGIPFLLPVYVLILIYVQKQLVEKKRRLLEVQFKDAMITITSALQAGYSLEHAWQDAYQVSWNVYGQKSNIVYLLGKVVSGRRLNIPMDYLLNEMYELCDLPIVGELAEIITISRKYGGNLPALIQKETNMIEDKILIKSEVLSATASVRYEAYIMDVIPPFILWYLNVTGSGFLSLLYDTSWGFVFMTLCLYLYLGTVFWQFYIMEKSIT